jgi:hypothetical protein
MSEPGIKIVDRRRFTAEGEMKSDAPADPPEPVKALEPAAAAKPAEKPPRPKSASGMDFMSFVASLATNALAALGALPEARARGIPPNPEMAREYIEILAMLEEKTHGNLTREEEASLKRMVSELRLHYVELVKRSAKIPHPS